MDLVTVQQPMSHLSMKIVVVFAMSLNMYHKEEGWNLDLFYKSAIESNEKSFLFESLESMLL